MIERGANYFPLYLDHSAETTDDAEPNLFAPEASGPIPNLTEFAKSYLEGLMCCPEDLFFHIAAVLHAPLYREENAGALGQDWPRIPLPMESEILRAGAALGREVAALLDPETPVPGVTDLGVRMDLRGLGELSVGDSNSKGKTDPDLAIAARWGYLQPGKNGSIVMPGQGRVTAGSRGQGYLDIHLNETTRWKDVPEPVWKYKIGGYQVLKKWLSYRQLSVLGRPLTSDEAQDFTHHVRRIAAIGAMHRDLDEHYLASIGS